jgi:thiamine biosynthesis protein ThiS
MIKIILNGEEKILAEGQSVADLILLLELDVKKIAVEKNLAILAPQDFAQVILEDGARVEIVHFIGGG